jgi:hypothetical protein
MKGSTMSGSLNDDVREVITELDADGGGFRTGEAANLLVSRVSAGGVCEGDGSPRPKVRQLMRMGATTAIKGFKGFSDRNARMRERAAEVTAGAEALGQGDFRDFDEDFAPRWLTTYHAWEEDDDAERKKLMRMTLPEVRAVIDLKTKKATEAAAVARKLKDIIDDHPEWLDNPLMTLADVLGIGG